MSDTLTMSVAETVLSKITKLFAANAAGELTGFTTENLTHVYMCLVKDEVDEVANDLLIKMVGPDWAEGWEASDDAGDVESEAKDTALAESLQQIDETDLHGTVNILCLALMFTCRELGWLSTSRATHDQWFQAKV